MGLSSQIRLVRQNVGIVLLKQGKRENEWPLLYWCFREEPNVLGQSAEETDSRINQLSAGA